jgi:putative tributyrin esterase
MSVVLPETLVPSRLPGTVIDRPSDPPVLYLLHGLSDDHTAWQRYTSIERYADKAGLAVVMPGAGRSFYADEATGYAYWTFISEELPRVVTSLFRLSRHPRDTFVAGLSMGGYGAYKLALTNPKNYAAAASISGALDVDALAVDPDRSRELRGRVFGGSPRSSDDLFALLDASRTGDVPPLHLSCGLQDQHLDANRKFVAAADARGICLSTDFREGGHDWEYWDTMIREVVDWMLGIRGDSQS